MKRVFVSGCYDIIHAGHVQFFSEARSQGDHLTVSFASADVLWLHKQRRSSLPDEHKQALLAAGRGESWARRAVEFGYYDEAHMINDIRTLAGATPQAMLAERTGTLDAPPARGALAGRRG